VGRLLDQVDSPRAVRGLPAAELPALCAELREAIIDVCRKVGGHLGASLGAVELVVGLHRVFHSPVDRLVFDVGHQAYAHKLLTGRGPRMGTLRQAGGVAPFLDPQESEHDAFAAGHACTALSVGLGMLEARRLLGQPGQVVAVVGDGALTGGLSFEGLNNAGYGALALKVVVNDNGMSISRNVGALERLLRTDARRFFESMGFAYLGPVDGNDLLALEPALRELKACHRPAVLHALTRKGKGFEPAESDADTRGHAMGPWELRDGKLVRSRAGASTFSDAFAVALEERMASDARVCVVTPAMLEGSSLTGVQARFPHRVFDVGIAEQHAVAMAAGLAREGLRPVVCLYSTFLQRAYDQLVHEVALPGLPVVLAVDRAGLVGADGATHQGAYDLGLLRALPGFQVAAALAEGDLEALLDRALASSGPFALRFPRGTLPAAPEGLGPATGPRWLQRPPEPELAFVTLGPCGLAALEAARGRPWAVLDALQLPLDGASLDGLAGLPLVTVEEGSVRGGLGGAVLEALATRGWRPKVTVLGLPGDRFVRHGEARAQRAELGLDAQGLRRAALELLAR
jgi:1-deoxy-D-xylulose-5-phosphate synthase